MMSKSISVSEISVPPTLVTETSKSHLSLISNSLMEESELFFVSLMRHDGKYVLVDRYDVYLAAVSSKIKKIPAVIVSDSDAVEAHLKITMKSVMNPVKVIRSMKPYVDEFGMTDAVDMLHLDVDFVKMYNIGIDDGTLDELDEMISATCDAGARTFVPFALFDFISKLEEDELPKFLESLRNLTEKPTRSFRWPHNTYLKTLQRKGDAKPQEIPSKKIQSDEINFKCLDCNAPHVVTHDGLVKRREQMEGIHVDRATGSTPKVVIPPESLEHMNLAKNKLRIITSQDIERRDILSYLDDKEFVILTTKKQGK